jgi:hypothetical protein
VEIGTEAAKFPEKECINGIFLAVELPGFTCRTVLYPFSFIPAPLFFLRLTV